MKDIIENVKIDDDTSLVFNMTTEEVEMTTEEGTKTVRIKALMSFPQEEVLPGTGLEKAIEEAQKVYRLIKTFPDKAELLNAVRHTRHPKKEQEIQAKTVFKAIKHTKAMLKACDACIAEIRPEGNLIAFVDSTRDLAPFVLKYAKVALPIMKILADNRRDQRGAIASLVGEETAEELINATKEIGVKFEIVNKHMNRVKDLL